MCNEQVHQNTKPVQGVLNSSPESRLPEPLLDCVTMLSSSFLVSNVTKGETQAQNAGTHVML